MQNESHEQCKIYSKLTINLTNILPKVSTKENANVVIFVLNIWQSKMIH